MEVAAVSGHSDCTSKSRVFKHSPLTFGTLARYDTSSAAFRLLIYGEKVGKKTFHGEEMGNF